MNRLVAAMFGVNLCSMLFLFLLIVICSSLLGSVVLIPLALKGLLLAYVTKKSKSASVMKLCLYLSLFGFILAGEGYYLGVQHLVGGDQFKLIFFSTWVVTLSICTPVACWGCENHEKIREEFQGKNICSNPEPLN